MINVSKIAKKYAGQWVAFATDRKTVLASGKTAKEAYGKAKKKHASPILSHMPKNLIAFVGSHEIRL